VKDGAAGASRRLLPGHEAKQWRQLFWVHVVIAASGLILLAVSPEGSVDRAAIAAVVLFVYLPLAAFNQLALPGPPVAWTPAWWLVVLTTVGIIALFQGVFPPVEVVALLGYLLDVAAAGYLYGLLPALAVAAVAEGAAIAAHVLGTPETTDPFILAMLAVMLAAAAFLVGGLAGERWRAYDRLEQARSDFMSTVSHELRTPIAGVHSFASLLDRHWDRLDEAERREMVGKIDLNVRFLDELVGRLLDLSRLEEGRFQLWRERVELLGLVRGTAVRMEPILEGHPIRVEGAPVVVEADRVAVDRIVENLLSNAAKFAPRGTPIEVTVGRDGDAVLVAVRDHGRGVPEADREAIFERYFRSAGTRAPGTGIGLAVVRQLAELHGGSAWMEDASPGARLVVRLPASEDERLVDLTRDGVDGPGAEAPGARRAS
jgi:signal transduction histidine kinase